MKVRPLLSVLAALSGAFLIPGLAQEVAADIAGEISTKTALLQSRITEEQRKAAGFGGRIEGWARFEAADNAKFERPVVSDWVKIGPKNDYIAKAVVGATKITLRDHEGNLLKDERGRNVTPPTLQPDTEYFWRVRFGPNPGKLQDGQVRRFKTLSGALGSRVLRIAVVQGVNVGAGADAALAKVAATNPDYVVFAGNSVAYDRPKNSTATTEEALQDRWHRLQAIPNFVKLTGSVGTFWLKNEHDYRFEDADSTAPGAPSAELGSTTFRLEVPVVDLADAAGLTFRHPQLTRDVELWFPEVRDYRSANSAPDGKDKSLWGTFQSEWVLRSLEGSTVPFKVFIQPTPLLGPTVPGDRDSHAGPQGFGTERTMFLSKARDLKLGQKGFVILTAAPWQYHTVNPDGIDEISIGSLTAPLEGAVPMAGSDLKQPYNPKTATAGFALVEVTPGTDGKPSTLSISLLRADTGEVVYKVDRTAAQ